MAYPRVQLMASPTVGATVLYDFNVSNDAYAGHEGFDSGSPEWRGEPGGSGGIEGYRTIRFTHFLDLDYGSVATSVATLGRLLLADSGWLLIQLKASSPPTWARVWRSSPSALSWDRVMLDAADNPTGSAAYAIDLALTADPYLVGESIALASGQVVNDLAASNVNLVPANVSSIETDASGWMATDPVFDDPTIARSTTRASPGAGAASLLVTWPTSTAGSAATRTAAAITGLIAGSSYLATAMVWIPVGSPAVRLNVGLLVGSAPDSGATKAAWVQVSHQFVATATSHYIYLLNHGASTSGQQVWMDDVRITLNNGATPGQLTLPDVVGDAPTPAVVTVTPNTPTDGALQLLHTTPVLASGTAAPIVYQVGTSDGWAAGSLNAGTSDVDWSGGSYRQTTATPATLSRSVTVQPGRYLAFVRAGAPAGSPGTWKFQLYDFSTTRRYAASVTHDVLDGTDVAQWHPVGDLVIPRASLLPAEVLAAESTITVSLGLELTRISGSGQLNVDALVLLPAPESSRTLLWATGNNGSSEVNADTIDGERDLIYTRDPVTAKLEPVANASRGGFPALTPGPNALHMLGACVGGATSLGISTIPSRRNDVISNTAQVAVTYRPRWLWPRP